MVDLRIGAEKYRRGASGSAPACLHAAPWKAVTRDFWLATAGSSALRLLWSPGKVADVVPLLFVDGAILYRGMPT
jgi:hypothetical protein